MMDKYWVVAIVVVFCIFLVIYTQRANASSSKISFKEIVQKEFNQYQVIEKSQSIMICEVSDGHQPDELVLIRIDPKQKKNMRNFGRRVTFTYPKQPSLREMRKDFAPYLQNS
ncbi:hypothetical protein [Acinetobacter sp. ANC 4470]|uniref:hypothetical protein n=1 Tax=Acinetobacter sp. ANC 4470 TaxID=1977881 RepID=UPI00148ADD66|nr:hypothetical protein [Acinetobacter sp. ANC 4470]